MNQKLTLSIDSKAVEIGKNYARKQGRSLSSIIETFLINLSQNDNEALTTIPVSEKLMSLYGISENLYTEEDYKAHLLKKHTAL